MHLFHLNSNNPASSPFYVYRCRSVGILPLKIDACSCKYCCASQTITRFNDNLPCVLINNTRRRHREFLQLASIQCLTPFPGTHTSKVKHVIIPITQCHMISGSSPTAISLTAGTLSLPHLYLKEGIWLTGNSFFMGWSWILASVSDSQPINRHSSRHVLHFWKTLCLR